MAKNKTKVFMIRDPKHPHFGETGIWNWTNYIRSTDQHLFVLDNCKHAMSGCYAKEDQVKVVEL